ncbi:MAG: NTPase [Halobacteriota archaeon]
MPPIAMLRLAVTGRPGIGKTTFCLNMFNSLKDKADICGFITQEVREKEKRVGFKLKDLTTGEEAWLAKVDSDSSVRVGKYGVMVDAVSQFSGGLDCSNSELCIIDEIGPMELKSKQFVQLIEHLLSTDISCIFTVHQKSRHKLVETVKKECEVITLDESNRDSVVDEVVGRYDPGR